jgi:NCAIR mutase (PurE)-related protein
LTVELGSFSKIKYGYMFDLRVIVGGSLLREILERLSKGLISLDDAEKLLRVQAIDTVGDVARLDVNREIRKGIPEIILAEGKTPEDLLEIVLKMMDKGRVIISRANEKQIENLKASVPNDFILTVNQKARMVTIKKNNFRIEKTGGKIGVLAAGTADIPVAEEARILAEEMGCEALTAYDVGIAGLHRLFSPLKEILEKDVDAIIVVAGREGALPSVVSGLVDIPVIGVPTSVGYGFGEKGVGALTAMLQACSLGLAVVNIDGGVAAGVVAILIANRAAKLRRNGSHK